MEIRKDYTQFCPSLCFFVHTRQKPSQNPYTHLYQSTDLKMKTWWFQKLDFFLSDTYTLMRQIQPAVVFGVVVSSFFCFLFFFRDVQVTCTEEFHYHIMASRSNMAAWSGCGTHRDIIYKTEDKNQSNYFVYPPVTKHTYSGTKGQFFNHMNIQLWNCNRPLPLLSLVQWNRWL